MRYVLAVPLEEVCSHFEVNERQSLKVVAPARLGAALFEKLQAQGVNAKPEAPLAGDRWQHTGPSEPNLLCESREFAIPSGPHNGGFTISFGTERAPQEAHVHRRHAEIYFSEHPLTAEYRVEGGGPEGVLELPRGGVLVFAPFVVHRVQFGGLTIVIEAPAVEGDKFVSGDGDRR
jgi:hypothetical protein